MMLAVIAFVAGVVVGAVGTLVGLLIYGASVADEEADKLRRIANDEGVESQ